MVIRLLIKMPSSSKMNLDDFYFIRTLGTGSFGRVKYAKYKGDGQHYAVKFMKKHEILKLKQGSVQAGR